MKRYLFELPVWGLMVVISLLFTSAWLGFILTSRETRYITGISSDGRPLYQDWKAYRYDGSLVEYTPNWGTGVQLLEPPTFWGLIAFWWPAVASVGLGLSTTLAALALARGRPLRKRIRIAGPRITLSMVMAVIGGVAAWLWLVRFDPYTRAAGTLIFGFMLHAGFRSRFLAKEAKARSAPAAVLPRAGIAGYSIVLLLALVWVICTLVWESYEVVRY